MRVYLDNCCFNRSYDDQSYLRISLKSQERERFDYTKWHQEYFAQDESVESFLQKASNYERQKSC